MTAIKLDAHARPPDNLRVLFKKWQKKPAEALNSDIDIIDTDLISNDGRLLERNVSDNDLQRAKAACRDFLPCAISVDTLQTLRCFEVKSLPGGHHCVRLV